MAETFRAGVRMRRIGRELRRWRERVGITNAVACKRARWAPSKLSKIENAQQPIQGVDVLALGLVYEVDEPERNLLFNACLTAHDRGWWHEYDEDLLVPTFHDFVELESEAVLVRSFKPDLVPGLLQTEAHATALAHGWAPQADDYTMRQRIAVRLARQNRLNGDNPMAMEAVIWEPALRQAVGGSTVMVNQLARLRELATRPNVTIQVIPLGSGAFPGFGTSFHLLTFAQEYYDDVVYLENRSYGIYVEDPSQVEGYGLDFAAVRGAALSPDDSIAMMVEIADSQLRSAVR